MQDRPDDNKINVVPVYTAAMAAPHAGSTNTRWSSASKVHKEDPWNQH